MLALLLNGGLPWSSFTTKSRPSDAIKIVLGMKLAFKPDKDLISCHAVLGEFLCMVRELAFEQVPDYSEWREKFRQVSSSLDELPGKVSFDWNDPSYWDESIVTYVLSSATPSKSSNISVKV